MIPAACQLFPHLFQPLSGPPLAAEWGRLTVPENRTAADGRLIDIPFIRFRSTAVNPGTPVVFLQGGPGTSVLSYLPRMWSKQVMQPPIDLADCIFIEHRGFGLSRPSLDCPGTYDVPLDQPGTSELYAEAHRTYIKTAVSFWQQQGVDLSGYNAREMAADIDDLRQALGYDRLTLYGGSFGSHHALAILRYFGQHIERAFLWSIEGPDHTIKLPANIQKQLVTLNAYLQEDPALNKEVPDLLDLMGFVLDKLKRPLTVQIPHPQTKEPLPVTIGAYDLQRVTAEGLGSVRFLSELPFRYLTMAEGDYAWLANQALGLRLNQQSNLMYEVTDIASGSTTMRRKQIAAEAPHTLLGDAINEPYHQMGDLFGRPDLGDEFRGRLISDRPIVLIGGTLDARTPISNAQELLPNFVNGRLITVKGASHDIAVRGAHTDVLARLRDSFFKGQDFSTSQLDAGFKFQAPINIKAFAKNDK